jgi:radical SAM-linked protein
MGNWVRFRFRKTGDLRWIGHLDLLRTLERLFRRAQVAISQTEGFHPHPRVHFPASLALGMVGHNEVLEVDLQEVPSLEELLTRLNDQQVPGLTFTAAELLPARGKRSQPRRLHYQVKLPRDRVGTIAAAIARFMAESTCVVQRDSKSLDVRPQVDSLAVEDDSLGMIFLVVALASAKPRDVLQALGATATEVAEWEIIRTEVELNDALPGDAPPIQAVPAAQCATGAPLPAVATAGASPRIAPAPSENFAEHRKHLPA